MMIPRLHAKGQLNGSGKFDWKDAVLDAAIAGGIAAVTAMITTKDLLGALESGILSFLSFLALKRGIVTQTKDVATQ